MSYGINESFQVTSQKGINSHEARDCWRPGDSFAQAAEGRQPVEHETE